MSIEGGWWTFTYEDEYETCPECGGTGKDNATLDTKEEQGDQYEFNDKRTV